MITTFTISGKVREYFEQARKAKGEPASQVTGNVERLERYKREQIKRMHKPFMMAAWRRSLLFWAFWRKVVEKVLKAWEVRQAKSALLNAAAKVSHKGGQGL